MSQTDQLVRLMEKSTRTLVVTGAGISTGSGIPDFRGPQGIWKRRQPVYFQEFLQSEEKRVEYWDYKAEGHQQFASAKANATHLAIAKLDQLGRLQAVVTQNIDGLHQAAGLDPEKIIEVHGTNRWIECLECKDRSEPGPAVEYFLQHQATPRCECGGFLKFATISFGQALEPRVLQDAWAAASECDLVLALGSTLSVQPAAAVPMVAVERGVSYVIINQGATDHDSAADLRIDGDVAEFLPPAVERLNSAGEVLG